MDHHTDLHHAISMHPYPLMHVSRATSHQGSTAAPHSPPASPRPDKNKAHSTAVQTSIDELSVHRHAAVAADGDVEGANVTRFNDPLQLSTRIKDPKEIEEIRASISRHPAIAKPLSRDAARAKQVSNFYADQNENIERLLKPIDDHCAEARAYNDTNALQYKIAVNGSLIANICLAILQVYGGAASGSLSLLTTMADALFDPLSTLTLILCHRAVNKVNGARYPQGKARIETAGNIAFCSLMGAVSLVLIVVSALELAQGMQEHKTVEEFHLPSTIAVAIAFVTKLCLFIYCYSLRERYSQVQILWEDHRNDLLINGAGLATSVLGSKVRWWIDPMGAIILSVLIITLWTRTAWSEFQLLIGVTADTSILQHLTYIAMTHSPLVKALDTVRAWHSGPRLIVEIDIVMDAELSLRETHDVAEELQMKIERLPNVDRAYVHVDFETSHAPEHFLKKEL